MTTIAELLTMRDTYDRAGRHLDRHWRAMLRAGAVARRLGIKEVLAPSGTPGFATKLYPPPLHQTDQGWGVTSDRGDPVLVEGSVEARIFRMWQRFEIAVQQSIGQRRELKSATEGIDVLSLARAELVAAGARVSELEAKLTLAEAELAELRPPPVALPRPPEGWAWRLAGIHGAWDELICPNGFAVGEVGIARNIHGGFYWRTLSPGLFCATDRTEAGLCVISEAVRGYERSGLKPKGESAPGAQSTAVHAPEPSPSQDAPSLRTEKLRRAPDWDSLCTHKETIGAPVAAYVTPEPSPTAADDSLPELPAGWRWESSTENGRPEDLIVSPEGWSLGWLEREIKPGWHRDRWHWRQTGREPGTVQLEGTLLSRLAAGLALFTAAERERQDQLARDARLAEDLNAPSARARLAAALRARTSSRASAALAQPLFSPTDVQAASSVQGGAVVDAESQVSWLWTKPLDARPPCAPVQGAFPVRASRRLAARGFRPRSGRLSAGESKGIVGHRCAVAKGGPSGTCSGNSEKPPSSPRLEKPECPDGALTSGPEESEKPSPSSRRALVCDPRGELRIAVPLFGPVELVWWLAVKLAWLVGVLAETAPGIRWLGVGWRRVDGVAGGALPTYWLGFVPPRGDQSDPEWPVSDGWAWRDYPHGPPEAAGFNHGVATSGHVVVMAQGDDGTAHHRANWGPWFGPRTMVATKPVRWSELTDLPNLLRVLREDLADAETKCTGCPLKGDCWNACEADFARGEPIATALHEGADAEAALCNGNLFATGVRLADAMTRVAGLCERSAAAVRLGGAGTDEMMAERLHEVARILREELASALVDAPAEGLPRVTAADELNAALVGIVRDVVSDLRSTGGELYPADKYGDDLEVRLNHLLNSPPSPERKLLFTGRRLRLATELEGIVRGVIVYARNQAEHYSCQECETERYWNHLADDLDAKLHNAQHPDPRPRPPRPRPRRRQAPADTAAERGE